MDEIESSESGSEDSEREESPGSPSEEEQARTGTEVSNEGPKKRRSRKRKSVGHRRKLRSKYESIEDFNPEARTAQTEELERIRRLELQQSLTAEESGSKAKGQVSDEGDARSLRGGESGGAAVMVVDLTEGMRDEGSARSEAIVIDSGSESGEEQQLPQAKRPRATAEGVSRPSTDSGVGKLSRGKYDVIGAMPDGRVMINLGHPANEPDICLAPQIMASAKPHQVRDELLASCFVCKRSHRQTLMFVCVCVYSSEID